MKKIIWIISLIPFIFGCGLFENRNTSCSSWASNLWVNDIGIINDDATAEEIQVLYQVVEAIKIVGEKYPENFQWIPENIYYIRDMNQPIPEVCKNGKCANIWSELPCVLNGVVKDPLVGHGGYAGNCTIFINRQGSKEAHLYGLTRHELVHAFWSINHGEKMTMLEREVITVYNSLY